MPLTSIIKSVVRFYADGFREMTWGRTLWLLILLKLFIIFGILKLFFFPDFLRSKAGGDEVHYVSSQLIEQGVTSEVTQEATPEVTQHVTSEVTQEVTPEE